MAKPVFIRYGKVAPHPVVKYSTIKVEVECQLEDGDEVDQEFSILRAEVERLIKMEGR